MRMAAVGMAMALAWSGSAYAQTSDDAYTTVVAWAKAFDAADVDGIAAMYTANASLWGTTATTLAPTPDRIRAYLSAAFKAGTKVQLQDHAETRLSADSVLEVGTYTFTRGPSVTIPARYTFVLVKQNGAWKILHQHSSQVPKM